MARRGMGSHVAPSTRSGPLMEFREETFSEWLRRQNTPDKPSTPPVLAMAAAAANEKADVSSCSSTAGPIPEGTN